MIRIVLFVALFFLHNNVNAQADSARHIRFSGFFGQKFFNPWAAYTPIYEGSVYFPTFIGAEIYAPQTHLSLDLRQEIFTSLAPNNRFGNIALLDKTTMAGLTWHFGTKKKRLEGWRLGLGYTYMTRRYALTSGNPTPEHYHGFTLFAGIPVSWLDIELRANPDQVDLIGGDKYSINFLYRFGAASDFRRKPPEHWGISFIAGLKCSGNRYHKNIFIQRAYGPLIFFPEYGFDVYSNKLPWTINLRRSLWIGIDAGNSDFTINGYLEYLSIGISREIPVFRRWQQPSFGIAHAWGRDLGIFVQSTQVNYYSEYGIAFHLTVPIRKINIEAKTIVPYHFDPNVVGPKGSFKDRMSVGFSYTFGRKNQ